MPPRHDDSEIAMIIRKWHKPCHTITLACTVASVEGMPPLVGFSEDVNKAWKKLIDERNLKQKTNSKLPKITSIDELAEETEKASICKPSPEEDANIEMHVCLIREEAAFNAAG